VSGSVIHVTKFLLLSGRMFGSVKYVAQSLVEVLVRHRWLLPYGAYMLAL